MSKLEELIKEFCPNGVEYKKLGELGKFYGGLSGKSKNDFTNGNEKFITYKNVYANPSLNLDVEDRVKINPGERQNTLQYGDIIFTGSSETPDECGFSSVITTHTSEKLYLNSFCFFFRLDNQSILLPDFAKHLFRAESIRYQIGKTASGVTRYNVSKDKMKQVQIPLPALPVQREIVRILDSFTLYSAELTAELTARRKQYEFYRDKLLSFDSGNIQRVKLKDICGKVSNIKWQNDDNEYAYIDLSSVDRETHKITIEQRINKENAPSRAQQIVNKGDVLFATTRPTLKRYCKITEEFNGQICSTGFVVLRPKINIILSTYLYYIVSSDRFFTYVEKNQEGTSYPAISDSKVKEFDFSLPPMEVQERIVKVLDNFDAICSDLGIGLPAEIEKRQKQYEYYREKLLTFDMKSETILRQTDRQTDRAD